MLYQGFIWLLILLLKSQLSEETGYNCSMTHDGYGHPLEECQPANFMLEDHLVECFSNFSKSNQIKSRLQRLFLLTVAAAINSSKDFLSKGDSKCK